MFAVVTNVTNATIIATLWADGELGNEEVRRLCVKSRWLANCKFYFVLFAK